MASILFDSDALPPPVTQPITQPELGSAPAHPIALLFLYVFRVSAVVLYIFSGLFTTNYVLSTLSVLLLHSLDYYTVRNFSGRLLAGLRYWNHISDSGDSVWVFESRPADTPFNAAERSSFWVALYVFPVVWFVLVWVSIVRFNFKYIPIVLLGFAFTVSNAVGFTYADRDAKMKLGSGMMGQMGGIMSKLISWRMTR